MGNTLDSMKIGERGKIIRVNSEELQIALMKLGVLPGDQFWVSNVAPLGDPIAITINRTKVSLRRKDASFVIVEPNK
ncbi:MAG: FeoA family protein [Bacteroidota bacterium]